MHHLKWCLACKPTSGVSITGATYMSIHGPACQPTERGLVPCWHVPISEMIHLSLWFCRCWH